MKHQAVMLLVFALVTNVGAGDDTKANKALKKLEGTWVLVSGEQNGKELSEEVIKGAKLVIAGNKHTVTIGNDTIVGTHKVDASVKPHTIDASDDGKKMHGIYEIKGDQFKVCFAEDSKDRPKEFTGKEGSGCFVHIWKRVKK